MTEQPKVSVIVAAYNAEKTLPRCLDSLAAQTLQEIEYVCVDDGSTDRTPAILDSYAETDPRFHVYHKANEGVSTTRQFGIDHIHGAYVIHLDADDYVEPYAYEHLFKAAAEDNADMVLCDAMRITETGIERMDYSAEDLSAAALVKRTLSWETSSLWNRLIRADLISRYSLRFPQFLQLAEDRYFLTCLLCRSLKNGDSLRIVYLNEAPVFYDNTSNPASLTKFDSFKESYTRTLDSFRILVDEVNMDLFGKDYYTFMLGLAFKAFWSFGKNDLQEEDFQSLFAPFRQGIERYTSRSYRKTLVLLALRHSVRYAGFFRWIAVPAILLDKIQAQA